MMLCYNFPEVSVHSIWTHVAQTKNYDTWEIGAAGGHHFAKV
jgi:hypothetical protein